MAAVQPLSTSAGTSQGKESRLDAQRSGFTSRSLSLHSEEKETPHPEAPNHPPLLWAPFLSFPEKTEADGLTGCCHPGP